MRLRRKAPALSGGRRRRQDSGSARAKAAFSYRSRRSDEEVNVGRQIPRETSDGAPKSLGRFVLRRFGLIILLIVIVASSVNSLSLSDDARLVMLSSPDSSPFLHGKAAYQQTASRLLAASLWNRNKITVDTDGISRRMLERFPELSSVSITLPLVSKRPTVYVQTARTALILSARNGSFVIDTSGKALLNADNLPADTRRKLAVVTDQSGLGVTLDRQVLSSSDVSFIRTVAAELAARHVGVSSMVLPPGTSELDVHISGQPYLVKFNLETGDARQQAGTFLAVQAQLKSQRVTPALYIDVRVDGRAYYK